MLGIHGVQQGGGGEDEDTVLGDAEGGRSEGGDVRAAQARPVGKFQGADGPIGVGEERRRKAGAARGAGEGDGVVGDVGVGGGERLAVRGVGGRQRPSFVGKLKDGVVETGEQVSGLQIERGERMDGRAQLAHGGGRVDALTRHLADHQQGA